MRAALVPHAPILVPSLAGRRSGATAEVVQALRRVCGKVSGDVLVVTPHAFRAGVYSTSTGSLDPFGVSGVSPAPELSGELTDALARIWGHPPIEETLDHGATVPLAFMGPGLRVATAGLPECSGPGAGSISDALHSAGSLALAIDSLPERPTVLFSAHTSAALSPAAPMTERESGKELHGRVVNSLRSNVAELASIPESLWAQGESCSPGVLHAMGLLYEGTARITAESSPFGVGYVVAEMA